MIVSASAPPSFDAEMAREVLDGDASALDEFVIWAETPQGYLFWSAEAICLINGMGLSDEAREQIAEWLEASDD